MLVLKPEGKNQSAQRTHRKAIIHIESVDYHPVIIGRLKIQLFSVAILTVRPWVLQALFLNLFLRRGILLETRIYLDI